METGMDLFTDALFVFFYLMIPEHYWRKLMIDLAFQGRNLVAYRMLLTEDQKLPIGWGSHIFFWVSNAF